MDISNVNPLDIVDPDNNYFTECDDNFDTFSIETLNSSNIMNEGSLNLMHHNARSILSEGRMDDYEHLFGAINNSFHILAFTETWLKREHCDTVILNRYNSRHNIQTQNVKDKNKAPGAEFLFLFKKI